MLRVFPVAALVLLCAVGVAFANDDPTVSLPGVQDLTPDNYDALVNGAKHAIVEFYAPWCGHCKRLTPEYKKLGELVAADPKLSSRIVIAKVDADAHRSLGERYGVRGFPTIKYMPRGKAPTQENAEDYQGARSAEAFLEFLQSKIQADAGFAKVDALADVVAGFVDGDHKALLAKATETVTGLTGEDKTNGELYVKYMAKVVEKGPEYLSNEHARLDKMLGSGSVHASKVEEMARKTSVLSILKGEDV